MNKSKKFLNFSGPRARPPAIDARNHVAARREIRVTNGLRVVFDFPLEVLAVGAGLCVWSRVGGANGMRACSSIGQVSMPPEYSRLQCGHFFIKALRFGVRPRAAATGPLRYRRK